MRKRESVIRKRKLNNIKISLNEDHGCLLLLFVVGDGIIVVVVFHMFVVY